METSSQLTVKATGVRARDVIARLRLHARRQPGDFAFRGMTTAAVSIVLAIVLGIMWILVTSSWPTIQAFGLQFLANDAFDPVHNIFGVRSAIFGTLITSAFAIVVATPIGIGTAVFIVEFCPRKLKGPLTFLVDSLAAIPSVVLGLWGFLTLAPWLQNTGEPWLNQHLGFLPFFQGQPHGLGILAAGLILTVMVLPILTAITREVITVVPISQREALLALGGTRWEVIWHAVLPYARSGIIGGVILALGRALGETIAVTMVIGNEATSPSLHLFNTGYTLASVIANQFTEATPGLFFAAVVEAGLLLLVITLLTNILARLLVARLGRSPAGGLVA
jgi:phosphate transport system permease protein